MNVPKLLFWGKDWAPKVCRLSVLFGYSLERSESRINSRYLEFTSISLIYSRKKELLFWLSRYLNRLTRAARQIRGDSKLSDKAIARLWPKEILIWRNSYEIMHLFREKIGHARSWLFGFVTRTEREVKASRGSGIFQSCFRMPRSYHGISSRYLRVLRYLLFWLEILTAKVFYRKHWSNLG